MAESWLITGLPLKPSVGRGEDAPTCRHAIWIAHADPFRTVSGSVATPSTVERPLNLFPASSHSQSHKDDRFLVRHRRKPTSGSSRGQEVRELGRRKRRLERGITRSQRRRP
jgi:hypothetical protein